MDLYLNGHGYIAKTQAAVTVPGHFTVKFYCKPDAMFDGRWEKGIVEGTVSSDSIPASGFGRSDFQMTTVNAGEQCSEHVLTRPGNMKMYYKAMREYKELKPLVHGAWVGVELVDKDLLCIKDKGKPCLRLSEILAALSVKIPGGAVVHWCACRSPYDDPEGATEQAMDMPKLPGETPGGVWG